MSIVLFKPGQTVWNWRRRLFTTWTLNRRPSDQVQTCSSCRFGFRSDSDKKTSRNVFVFFISALKVLNTSVSSKQNNLYCTAVLFVYLYSSFFQDQIYLKLFATEQIFLHQRNLMTEPCRVRVHLMRTRPGSDRRDWPRSSRSFSSCSTRAVSCRSRTLTSSSVVFSGFIVTPPSSSVTMIWALNAPQSSSTNRTWFLQLCLWNSRNTWQQSGSCEARRLLAAFTSRHEHAILKTVNVSEHLCSSYRRTRRTILVSVRQKESCSNKQVQSPADVVDIVASVSLHCPAVRPGPRIHIDDE